MLEKISVVDKIEVLESGLIQVRTANRIIEDGNILSESYHRHCLNPLDDYSNEDSKVQAICAVTFTPELIESYQSKIQINEQDMTII